jgi:hypothetical protein
MSFSPRLGVPIDFASRITEEMPEEILNSSGKKDQAFSKVYFGMQNLEPWSAKHTGHSESVHAASPHGWPQPAKSLLDLFRSAKDWPTVSAIPTTAKATSLLKRFFICTPFTLFRPALVCFPCRETCRVQLEAQFCFASVPIGSAISLAGRNAAFVRKPVSTFFTSPDEPISTVSGV